MKEEAREYYYFLLTVCQDENIPLVTVYRQLREVLERLCRTQMPDGSLQMTDLSARVSFVASKVGLSVVEQNRLHTFRLTSNAVLNRQSEPSRENLLRDIKTLTFFVKPPSCTGAYRDYFSYHYADWRPLHPDCGFRSALSAL